MKVVGVAAACLVSAIVAAQPRDVRAIVKAEWDEIRASQRTWPDASEEGIQKLQRRDRATLAELLSVSRSKLMAEDALLYDLLRYELERRLAEFDLKLYLTPFGEDPHLGIAPTELGTLLSRRAPSDTSRLDALPDYIRQLIGLLRHGKSEGLLPSRHIARNAAERTAELLRGGLPPLLRGLLTEPLRERIYAAVRQYEAFLISEYAPACPEFASISSWPNGGAVYAHLARRATSTDMKPAAIRELGINEVSRIRKAMEELLPALGFDGTLEAFLRSAIHHQRFYYATEEELLDACRSSVAKIESQLPKLFIKMPKAPLAIEPVRHGGIAAMYRGNSPAVLVEVSRLDLRPKFEVVPLMLHEGMPGHHLQLTRRSELYDATKYDAVRQWVVAQHSQAASEGWALYAETLGYDLGLYVDPIERFGQLSMELIRAVRIVVDTGLHLDGWDMAKAREYFMNTTGKSAALANSEVARSHWPANQLAYKIGQQRYTLFRYETQKTLGPKFDIRRFHDRLLEWGTLPLDVLQKQLDTCVRQPNCM